MNRTTTHIWIFAAVAFTAMNAFAVDARPTKSDDIRAAMTRAHELRKGASGFNPAVAGSYALLLKSGDERCGHAVVSIEKSTDAAGVYRLTEEFKAAMDDGQQSVIVTYAGNYVLDAGLGLVSGELSYNFDTMKNDGDSQQIVHKATLRVKDDKLEWETTEQNKKDKSPLKLETKPIALHGLRPVPKNALIAFAALVGVSTKDFKPNPKEGYCLPVLELDWEQNTLELEPAWVILDQPTPAFSKTAPPKGTAMELRVRYLFGDVTEKGLEVDTPQPETWHNPQTWALDEKFRPLSHPAPDDVRLQVAPADAATLKTDEPLDLSRIAAAMKAAIEKAERDEKKSEDKKK